MMPVALFLIAALMLWAMLRCMDAFGGLGEAERTRDYRLAMFCGRNPHDTSIRSEAGRRELLAAGRR